MVYNFLWLFNNKTIINMTEMILEISILQKFDKYTEALFSISESGKYLSEVFSIKI